MWFVRSNNGINIIGGAQAKRDKSRSIYNEDEKLIGAVLIIVAVEDQFLERGGDDPDVAGGQEAALLQFQVLESRAAGADMASELRRLQR